MYKKLVPVDSTRHRGALVGNSDVYWFVAGSPILPVYLHEIGEVAVQFPIAFATVDGRLSPVAICAMERGRNYIVDPIDGNWQARYVPAIVAAYPFALVRQADKGAIICVDEAADECIVGSGDPIYLVDGAPGPSILRADAFFATLAPSIAATDRAVALLERHQLFKEFVGSPARHLTIRGLLTIDEKRLNDLDGDVLINLRDTGALALAYSQMLSLRRLPVLAELGEVNDARRTQADAPPADDIRGDGIEFVFGAPFPQ